MTKPFVAVDWGTTSFRAYHVDGGGRVVDEVADGNGILAVSDGAFDSALEQRLSRWDRRLPILAAGMITSRKGWIDIPYRDCPARPAAMAAAFHRHHIAPGRTVHFSTRPHQRTTSQHGARRFVIGRHCHNPFSLRPSSLSSTLRDRRRRRDSIHGSGLLFDRRNHFSKRHNSWSAWHCGGRAHHRWPDRLHESSS